jgi:subtilase family serine protease
MSASISEMSPAFTATEVTSTIPGVLDPNNVAIVDLAIRNIQVQLTDFAQSENAFQEIESIYDNPDAEVIQTYLQDWSNHIFKDFPHILILDDSAMQGAQGAYSASGNEIYLTQSLVQKDTLTGLQQVLLEEYGHSLDILFNPYGDTVGDEGELFQNIVSGMLLTASELHRIITENDAGYIVLNGQLVAVEQSSYGVDFNQDDHPDILWRDPASGQNIIWFMGGENNSQIVGGNHLVTVPGNWEIKGSTDFNRDNSIDLLWRDPASGQNVIWFMDGANSASAAYLVPVGGSWDIKGIADFNNDDIDDLLWRDPSSGQNVVWFMGGVNNGESIAAAWLPAVGGGWDIKGVADFNNDDRPDLLWRDPASGQNVVWFMGGTNNTQPTGSINLSSVGGGWDIEGVADFNNDGSPDLFWRDLTSGQNVVWFMGGSNNSALIGGITLPTVQGGWQPILSGWRKSLNYPDLVVQNPTVSSSVQVGGMVSLNANVKNLGTSSAGPSTLKYYLSSNTTWDTNDIELGSSNITSLSAGSTTPGSLSFNYDPNWGTGQKYILFKADSTERVVESNETNNVTYQSINVQAPVAPDLVVVDSSVPSSVKAGGVITISAYVKNQGSSTAGPSTLNYYLSNDTTWDENDLFIDSDSVGTLYAGSKSYEALMFQYETQWGLGNKYILFKADANDTVTESSETNNIGYQAISVFEPQIHVLSPNGGETFIPGSSYTIQWEDNLDGEDVDISLFRDNIEIRTLGKVANTGSYTWTVPSSLYSGSNYKIRVASGLDIRFYDQSDGAFNIAQTSLISPLDLNADHLQVNNGMYGIDQLKPGDKASIDFEIFETNMPEDQYFTNFYLSTDNIIDDGDIWIGQSGIPTGDSALKLSSFTLPYASNSIWNLGSVDQNGYALYYVGMKVDPAQEYREFNEGNNIAIAAFWVYLPDKIPTQPTINLNVSDSSASEAANSGKFTFTRTGSTANSLAVSYNISGTATNTSDYATIGNTITLQPGQSSVDLVISPVDDTAIEGNETITLTLAANSAYTIGSTSQGTITITDNDFAKPDLTISSTNVPSSVTIGESISLSATVKNQGTASAASSYLKCYLSNDATYSTDDVILSTSTVTSLGAGLSSTVQSGSINTANWATGNKYLLFVADANNQIAESNEGNNLNYRAITINSSKPDLVVQSPNAPTSATVGESITISASTKNLGQSTASASYLRYWLSDNATLETSNDRLLSSDYVGSLNAGSSEYDSYSFAYNASWGTGTKYILFQADGTANVAESDEANNVVHRAIVINPPPYITVISPNGGNSLTAGSTYTISWNDNISDNVALSLYKGGVYHSSITSSTISSGSYSWTLSTTLSAGNDYAIRVTSLNSNTLYDESDNTFSITAAPGSGFNIQFDYRFDTNGWFTAERKAALEAAATIWESIILDEFADIPIGTPLRVQNPQTTDWQTSPLMSFNSDYVIDDLVVFVGAKDLALTNFSTALGVGGPSFISYSASLTERYRGADFEPWTGAITFDSDANWFFDANPLVSDSIPSGTHDFVSVAVHEIGHILGIGTADAFDNLVVLSNSNYYFVGPNATAQNGGVSMPLDSQHYHIKEGHDETSAVGEAAMDPSLTVGTRKLVTKLDAALLDDIGYSIDYSKTYYNP